MRVMSPSPISIVMVITMAFTVICIFTGILKTPSFPRNASDETPLYLGGANRQRASPSFLISSEQNRRIFLKKVEDEILKGRDPSELPASGKVGNKWFAVWNAFAPVYSCPHVLIRVGTLVDGGKWTCGVDIYEKTTGDPCVVYSLGVGGDSTFEIEIVKRTNCTVYAFDHTRSRMAFPSDLDQKLAERIRFLKVGIGSKAQVKENSKLKTLKEIMDQNGHAWIDFLKMDIERNEFPVLKDIAEDFQTFPFGHLNLEIHLKKGDTFGKMFDLWTILEKKGLRAFFWEPNFNMIFRNNPFLMEFSFINVVDSKSRLLHF